ncbi:hypothetical protein ACWF9B_00365 [Streptomyces sp. NPDC055089]
MTWALSTVLSLLLRAVGPLIRRGLPHLALAVMTTIGCGAALAAGRVLLYAARWALAEEWPLLAVSVGLLGSVAGLAAFVGLTAVVLLMPLAVTADCLSRRPGAERDRHSTTGL